MTTCRCVQKHTHADRKDRKSDEYIMFSICCVHLAEIINKYVCV